MKSSEEGFWEILFRVFHERHRTVEPVDHRDYKNIRMALYSLRTFTGMTTEQLAIQIGIAPGTLNMIEVRGGVLSYELCERCRQIALEFRYPKLAEFFKLEGLLNTRRKRNTRSTADVDDPMNE